jgi:excisionase family DNA binding protein
LNSKRLNFTYEQQCAIFQLLSNINIGSDNEMCKSEAADYLGVSRATFDNYVKNGYIPKGKKVGRFKELRWYKSDLDIYLSKK